MNVTVCIPTRDRPGSLGDLLEQLTVHLQGSGYTVSLCVSDQSKNGICKANARAVAEFSQRFAVPTLHMDAGSAPQDEWVRHIGHQLGTGGRLGYGINRNLLLLASAGTRTVWIDDDVELELACFEDPDEGQGISGDLGWRIWPLDSMPDSPARHPVHLNVLDEMVRALGCSDAGRQIGICLPGVRGDTGLATHGVVPFVPGSVPDAAMADQEAFLSLLRGKSCVRQPKELAVSGMDGFVSTVFALDNRRTNCPFMPVGRGEDQVWAVMFKKLMPQTDVMALPWTLGHREKFSPKPMVPNLANCALWTSLAVDMFEAALGSSEKDRLHGLGGHLQHIGALPLPHFIRDVLRHALQFSEGEIDRLGKQAERLDAWPWVMTVLNSLLLEWERFRLAILIGDIAALGGDSIFIETMNRCRRLGDTIGVWPRLWAECKEIRLARFG